MDGVRAQRSDALTVTLDSGQWPNWAIGLNPRAVTMEPQQWAAVADWVREATVNAEEIRRRDHAARNVSAMAARYR